LLYSSLETQHLLPQDLKTWHPGAGAVVPISAEIQAKPNMKYQTIITRMPAGVGQRRRSAFTMTEILVVLAILGLLSALVFSAFATARGRARQMACASNLKQLGVAVTMYLQDNDSFYPRAVDALDKAYPSNFADFPGFQADISQLPDLPHSLETYVKSAAVFHCPSDTGFTYSDLTDQELDAMPTSFAAFGSSYYYRTEMAAARYSESQIGTAAKINLIFDGAGKWHGGLVPPGSKRYNVLFADMHVKNVSEAELDAAWRILPTSETD
jgi:prepilin-type N-terminal cleavage/methylation domain-containing protein